MHPHAAVSAAGEVQVYDRNGNLTSGGKRALTWNADNQPASINDVAQMFQVFYCSPNLKARFPRSRE